MRLAHALRLQRGMSVAFTGAGGKSSSLAVLAGESRGHFPIVLTTTTRLAISQRSFAEEAEVVTSVAEVGRLPIGGERPILVTGVEVPAEGKLLGLEGEVLDALARRCSREGALLAIEADGARGRWLKAPAAHEPVVPPWIDIVSPVMGLAALGMPLGPAVAHRAERVASLLEIAQGEVLTGDHLVRLMTSAEGGLRGVPGGAEVRALLTGGDVVPEGTVERLSGGLLAAPRIRAVLAGTLGSPDPIGSVASRAAAIVLAAGAGERFGGPKQVAAWGERPLISHVIAAARRAGLSPIVVVLGARAEIVRQAVASEGVVFVENLAWEEGQSTSVRAGLEAVESQVEAAVFLLADMPQVGPVTIQRLRAAHQRSLAAIVAPAGGGRRGNPVLFDRRVFPALHGLSGDQGGRALIERFGWEAVEADPAEFAEVDSPEDLAALDHGR